MLSMQNISKVYRAGMVETHALREFSLEVREGEFISVTGPSGSGKTTFLNIAGLLESFTSGRYELDGRDVSALSDSESSKVRNEKIGFIFQSFNLIPDLNLFDNVDVPLRYRGFNAAERKRRIEKVLETVGLADRMDHRPNQLSGGQQQRVAVARALVGQPLILLADEPTGNLDSRSGEQVMSLLNELHAGGATICMVTHDPRYLKYAERTIHLFDGQIVDETDPVLQAAAI